MKKRSIYISVLITTIIPLTLLLLSGYITEIVVETHTQNALIPQRSCIVIDAGHGGIDGGAVSCTGIPEATFNLEIALRLNDLMHLLGIKTIMIRNEDISIYTEGETIAAKKISDLKHRVSIINNTPKAILVSIHQNYFHDSRYRGAQVFYNKKDPILARQLQTNLVQTINNGSNRKAKKSSGIYLLDNINCTAALVECGFISNPAEEQLLQTTAYQKKLCCVIAATLSCYIHNNHLT